MESNIVEETSTEIKPKMKYTGKVVKTSLAGAMIDIGVEQPTVLHISQIISPNENEPIKRVEDVLKPGQEIEVYVRKVRGDHIELTMFKPLDLEWREIKKGMTVKGTVTRLEKFGAFVEIGAERPGLVHISEMAHGYVRQPSDVVKEGDEIEAEVLDVNRKKKQIKLSMKALQPEPVKEEETFRPLSQTAQREKPVRRKKVTRKPRNRNEEGGELAYDFNAAQQAEAEPTAMEIALREAMERAKNRKKEQEEKKRKSVSPEQEDILERTLENKRES